MKQTHSDTQRTGLELEAGILRPGQWPTISPSRFAAMIGSDLRGVDAALLGMPDDLGVRLNSGRPGAAEGPTAIRAALASYGVADPAGIRWPKVADAGDVIPASSQNTPEACLHETHRRVSVVSRALASRGVLPVGLGGGHDLTFPFVRGVIEATPTPTPTTPTHRGRWAGVYFDAHLDVRETVGSGMPFRRLVTDCGVGSLLIIGQNTLANSRAHAEWFAEHGGIVADDDLPERALAGDLLPEDLTSPLGDFDHLFVSVDMDVLDAAHAPGVSALNPCGLTVREVSRMLFVLMQHPKVRCVDFMELSPPHDGPKPNAPTARAAAHLILTALMGWKVGRLLVA